MIIWSLELTFEKYHDKQQKYKIIFWKKKVGTYFF